PRAAAGAAAPDAIRFDYHGLDPSERAGIRGGAAGQAAADDDDLRGVCATEPRVLGDAGAGGEINPGRDAVAGAHELPVRRVPRGHLENGRQTVRVGRRARRVFDPRPARTAAAHERDGFAFAHLVLGDTLRQLDDEAVLDQA